MAKTTELTRSVKLYEATELLRVPLASERDGGVTRFDHAKQVETGLSVAEKFIEGEFTRIDPENRLRDAHPVSVEASASVRCGKVGASLTETLRNLASGGMPVRGDVSILTPKMVEGTQPLSLVHTGHHGTRAYRLYAPSGAHSRMPLIVMLHGCTQTPKDFATGSGMNEIADGLGFMVAYPAQGTADNMRKCLNWFRPEDQNRGRGEPALVAGIVNDIQNSHSVDARRVYVAGLSAGGAAAAVVAAAYPEIFSAVGVHSGLPAGAADNIQSALAAMRNGAARTQGRRDAHHCLSWHG